MGCQAEFILLNRTSADVSSYKSWAHPFRVPLVSADHGLLAARTTNCVLVVGIVPEDDACGQLRCNCGGRPAQQTRTGVAWVASSRETMRFCSPKWWLPAGKARPRHSREEGA